MQRRVREVRDTDILPALERRGMDRPLDSGELKAALRPLLALGYPGTVIAKDDGGAGLDYVSLGITVEALAPVLGFLGFHVVPRQIAMLGSPAQKARYLPRLIRGEALS